MIKRCLITVVPCLTKYEVSTHKIMQDSTNTRDLDKKFVQTPRTQPGYVGKFSIFIVVLIFLFTFQNVNNKIKTTTENLPTQAGCVPGIPTDFLSKSLVFVESCMILWVDTSYLYWPMGYWVNECPGNPRILVQADSQI